MSAGKASRIVPGGGLAAHEARGGHTLLKHVGKTIAELVARANSGEVRRAASSFINMAVADDVISLVIEINQTLIKEYLAGNKKEYLSIEFQSATTTGISVPKWAIKAQ